MRPRPPAATLELGLAADFTALVGLTSPRDFTAVRVDLRRLPSTPRPATMGR